MGDDVFGTIKRAITGLFAGRDTDDAAQGLTEEQIQTEFKKRYHHFKLLLTANKKALEIMSEMEEALNGRRAFGMAFIRAHSTAASVNVYKIVEHLNAIAPGKYAALYNRIKDIQRRIGECWHHGGDDETSALVIPLEQAGRDLADQVGGKMAGLGEIVRRAGLPVPPGFAVTARAYRRLVEENDLKDEINRLLQTAGPDDQRNLLILSSQIRNKITGATVPADVAEAILAAYKALCAPLGRAVPVSLRSSALGEDEAGQTFAGQFSSKLNVAPDDILQSYKEVLASKYSPQAMTYRLNKGIPDEDVAMCVGVMAMVDAVAGGVIYSRNPLDIRDDAIRIHSALGLPKSVVDGSVATDEFVVRRGEPPVLAERHIRQKDQVFVCLPGEGVCRAETTGDRAGEPSITDEQAISLAAAAVRLETMYGAPVDVEWAVDAAGAILFLQCRELVQLPGGASPDRARRVHGEPLLADGATASPGVGCGPVFVVRREADLLQFPRGAVLVAIEAPPRYASIIDRVAAIVTEKGGAAGHLANVAREFRVPALMAVAGAATRLAPGVEVTVDADGRAVYPGRVQELLDEAEARRQPAPERQTPMHAILRRVMDQITPLFLIDPNVPEFSPENCRTLHDITRFCHEKSVTEMFTFGQEFHFSKRAAKQLKYKGTAMKWWFINLDDGFTHDVPGKFVKLEEICSIPVGALWDGIVAMPWQGPPPMDGRGFMSIIAQASTNPHLEAAAHSSFAERNYFMVSRNYLCLSSRFGFHFCTVESLVGDRPQENYVSFQFKGGAAEFSRRRRRAEFVAEILEVRGFSCEVSEDASFARISAGPEEEMLTALKVIGYMLMHTRQLDMIMHNEAMVQSYRQKILDDLVTVVGAPGREMPACPARPAEAAMETTT
ncbi:MAG: PEP/pyruvate-binding domain-containing protein [Solidesulfovibrio sp.]|uniref:PEP/pyruvate-binding domain-containing protein n=1 Tax=Solidesulfovibrio sp. TaxID=2910990 RepID=UPI002B2038EC|nr:PEP/pyruvate-binding domain-containing protein [Solidesulfovibrio sp.]MEA4856963.1 PEP/pyruvate-binding domain-containing protein [Solidesulfovibrio sp.]